MKNKKFFYNVLFSFIFIFSGKLFAQAEPVTDVAMVTVQPAFLSVTAKGDRAKFEEDNWTSRNASGGIANMAISKQLNKEDSLEFTGRAIAGNNDYDANLVLSREGLGSLIVAFKEFRKYFDPTGGFYSGFAWNQYNPVEPNRALHLDIGNFKIEGTLSKEDSPEYSLAYERDTRRGTKSLLEWGDVVLGATTRQLYPAVLETHETTDRVKAGVKYVTKTSEVSAEQAWESTRAKNEDNYREILTLPGGALTAQNMRLENFDSDLYTTTLRGSKDLNDKLTVSCGVLYNNYKGGSLENIAGTGSGAKNMDNPASLEQNAITVFPTISFKPFKNLAMSFGSKAEFINKNGDSDFNTSGNELINITSNTYQKIFTQNLQLKYNGMKSVVWYGDAGFEKKLIRQFEQQTSSTTASNRFSRKTDSVADTNNFTLGAKWYPLSKANISVEDNYKNKFIDNRNEFLTGDVLNGYRGYIDRLELSANSPKLKLNYKPFRWIASTLGYTYEDSVYGVRTRAGSATEVSKNKIHAYSAEVTLIPIDYFYFSLFYERRNDFTSTRADGAEGTNVQQPDYKANVDVLGFNCSYAFSKGTTLTAGFSMYKTDNFNDFSASGMPYGLDNFSQDVSFGIKHTLNKNSSLEFKYKYLNYAESSNNHINDYEAHLLSASMNMAF
ncbi:MAG: hypothetical protein Q7K98_07860 [Candidatus Omnitrophota bacterium]|nr:hypothetical protein [Candidatus Omnitrophota bacterium]